MAARHKRNNRHSTFSLFDVVSRHYLFTLVTVTSIAITWLIFGEPSNDEITEVGDHEIVYQRGPHNGILMENDGFAIELTIFEEGVQPEFRAYPYFQDHPVDPSAVNLHMELTHSEDILGKFDFVAQEDFLRANNFVKDFHATSIIVTALYRGKTYYLGLSVSHSE